MEPTTLALPPATGAPTNDQIARALVREMLGSSAFSALSPAATIDQQARWVLCSLEAAIDEDEDGHLALGETGIAATRLRHWHHRYDDFFRRLVESEQGREPGDEPVEALIDVRGEPPAEFRAAVAIIFEEMGRDRPSLKPVSVAGTVDALWFSLRASLVKDDIRLPQVEEEHRGSRA